MRMRCFLLCVAVLGVSLYAVDCKEKLDETKNILNNMYSEDIYFQEK